MKLSMLLAFVVICQFALAQDQMYDICPLKVGQEIPNTNVTNSSNQVINIADLSNKKPTVLIFYRGAWCGYCTRHLGELNDLKIEIEDLGFQIYGITVDKYTKLEESNKRSESEIEVFSDSDMETIKAFGLNWNVSDTLFNKYVDKYGLNLEDWSGSSHHMLPVPSIYVLKEGRVVFQFVNPNYKERLKPETLLAVLKTL